MKRLILVMIAGLLASVGHAQSVPVGEQLKYGLLQPASMDEFFEVDPSTIDGEILWGTAKVFMRIDHVDATHAAGIFAVEGIGQVRYFFPVSEHMTIIQGVLLVKDETGETKMYGPGDSYFIRAGTEAIITQLTPTMQKSFLNYAELE